MDDRKEVRSTFFELKTSNLFSILSFFTIRWYYLQNRSNLSQIFKVSSTVRINAQIDRMRMQLKRQAEKAAREAQNLKRKDQYAQINCGEGKH